MWIVRFIAMIAIVLTSLLALVLAGWQSNISFGVALLTFGLTDFALLAGLYLAMRSGRRVPAGLFLVQLMTAFFVWQLVFDILGGILLLIALLAGYLLEINFLGLFPVVLALTIILALYSVFIEPRRTVINRFQLKIKNLPLELENLKIAQISDIHLGAFFPVNKLRKLLEKAAKEGADVLVVTGDLFDSTESAENQAAAELLDEFTTAFPKGIYFCWGNHEYYRDFAAIGKALAKTRVRVLKNSAEKLGDLPLYMLGVDYPMGQGVGRVKATSYTEKAMAEVPKDAAKILLAHHPDFFADAKGNDIFLTLSGHTHGGQLGIFGHAVMPPVFKYVRGMYEEDGKYLYVHRGNGGRFPFRLGCTPEIACFILNKK